MKFIHFADAHLDSPFRGLSFLPSNSFNQIYQAADQSLKEIVDLALNEKVDLVLIAGDTFDSNRPSPHSQLFFAQEIKRLTDAKIQVVMIFGNHDHMNEEDLLVEPSPYFKLLGSGEKVESVSYQTQSGFQYDVVGFSYLNNHITEDLVPQFPQKSSAYTFGLMHAQQKGDSGNVYVPFNLSEIAELNYDYFALGHIHRRRVLSERPWIVYPGNIQGRHINETGAKGCYLGIVDEQTGKTQLEFKESSPIIWEKVSIRLTGEVGKKELQAQIKDAFSPKKPTFYSLTIENAQFLTSEERDLIQDSDYWESLSQSLAHDSHLVDVRFKTELQASLKDSDQKAFKQAQSEVFTQDCLNEIAKAWIKKSELAQSLAEDPDFLAEVKEISQVKLSSKLRGVSDEAEKD